MFDRLQKPFLTVETGEAYQPVRLTYEVFDRHALFAVLSGVRCVEEGEGPDQVWTLYWRDECDELHFESLESFQRNADNPLRLASLQYHGNYLYVNLRSFKRACLVLPFLHQLINSKTACIHHADFINKVFATDERLPHGFSEMFSDEELQRILAQRLDDYHHVQEKCELAKTAEEAFSCLADYTRTEARKRLPYAERYVFSLKEQDDAEVIFLGFYIFLRARELVAIKRWFGEAGYSLADAVDETVESVFGDMGIDLID